MQLPKYNGKDNLVMVSIVPISAFLFNVGLLGEQYISSVGYFLATTVTTAVALGFYFVLCGAVAVVFKNRLPAEHQLRRRLTVTILTFLVLSALYLYALFAFYSSVAYFNYRFNERGFVWAYFALGITNIFLTFLMEGISRYNEWKKSSEMTYKLNQAIKKSQLDGLRSQVNPHFLFNSLNSLSSLIQEDERQAEKFLDEMSKVYRYMLRDDPQWVPLETELKFIRSYLHLLHVRFGEALKVDMRVPESFYSKGIAPLTLQTIIENACAQNIVRKSTPLSITLFTNSAGDLVVQNNVMHKKSAENTDWEASLDHLVAKYKLLQQPLHVDESVPGYRQITIPLHPIPAPV
jgi:two-component system, LytTR family, sensor kinase